MTDTETCENSNKIELKINELRELRELPKEAHPTAAKEIIDFIFREAERMGITQATLAEKLHCSPSYLSRLKKQSNLTLKQVEKLCKSVGFEPEYHLKPIKI